MKTANSVLTTSLVIVLAATAHAVNPIGIPANYQLLFSEDFQSTNAASRFVYTDPAAWTVSEMNGRRSLELKQQSNYQPTFRSPVNIALIAHQQFGDFILEVDLLQTSKEYGHRDLCLFYGFQSPTQFYYTHIATKADDHAHNCFLVQNAPRTKIARETTAGFDWGQGVWHKVRLERKASDGTIRVWVDDLSKPMMSAENQVLGPGWVGFGSFDDTGKVSNIRIWGPNSEPKTAPPFPRAATK